MYYPHPCTTTDPHPPNTQNGGRCDKLWFLPFLCFNKVDTLTGHIWENTTLVNPLHTNQTEFCSAQELWPHAASIWGSAGVHSGSERCEVGACVCQTFPGIAGWTQRRCPLHLQAPQKSVNFIVRFLWWRGEVQKLFYIFCVLQHSQQFQNVFLPKIVFSLSLYILFQIRIWNLPRRECKQSINAHDGFVRGICFNPDGESFFSVRCVQKGTSPLWSSSQSRLASASSGKNVTAMFGCLLVGVSMAFHPLETWFIGGARWSRDGLMESWTCRRRRHPLGGPLARPGEVCMCWEGGGSSIILSVTWRFSHDMTVGGTRPLGWRSVLVWSVCAFFFFFFFLYACFTRFWSLFGFWSKNFHPQNTRCTSPCWFYTSCGCNKARYKATKHCSSRPSCLAAERPRLVMFAIAIAVV